MTCKYLLCIDLGNLKSLTELPFLLSFNVRGLLVYSDPELCFLHIQVLIVDLDHSDLIQCEGDESRIIPKKLQRALKIALKDENGIRKAPRCIWCTPCCIAENYSFPILSQFQIFFIGLICLCLYNRNDGAFLLYSHIPVYRRNWLMKKSDNMAMWWHKMWSFFLHYRIISKKNSEFLYIVAFALKFLDWIFFFF